MPNWCDNFLTIQSEDKDYLQMLHNKLQADESEFLQVLRPVPTGETTWINWNGEGEVTKTLDGEWDWDWCVTHWGTKWDINDDGLVFEDTEDGYATISGWFESAWAPPIEAYNTYMENNEEIQILATYEEGGMDFAGIYDNGDDDYMEGLSAVCERIVRGTETLEEQTELFQRLDEEFDLVENRREYIEDEMEEERRDEKNGVYPQHEDVAN